MVGGITCFDNKLIRACNPEPGAENVAHVNEFKDFGLERMGIVMQALAVEFHALGPDGDFGPLADGAHVHRQGVNDIATVELDDTGLALDLFDYTVKRVVLPDELRNEAVSGFS